MIKKKKKSRVGKKRNHLNNDWLKALVIAILIILFVKVFVFEPYVARSTNMGNTVYPGEIILIGKLNYGPRVPITLLSLPFFGYSNYLDWIKLPEIRLPGYSRIIRFDLVHFNFPFETDKPIDKRQYRISRIIGLPGENIEVHNYKTKINQEENDVSEENLYYKFLVIPESEKVFKQLIEKYNIKEGSKTGSNTYTISLSKQQALLLKEDIGIKKITLIDNSMEETDIIFPDNKLNHWTKRNFGPLHIPKKGEKIILDEGNIHLYYDIIKFYEKNDLVISDGTILINGLIMNEYTFKSDYYFVLDDNRSDGKDSRYWGFLPESHVVGKCLFILYSGNKQQNSSGNKMFSRLFKRII